MVAANEAAAERVAGTIVSEGPYLGPVEYLTGVQEIVAAIGVVGTTVAPVVTTLMGGFSAVTAAVAASATAISTTVGVEAAQTRALIRSLLDDSVRMPTGKPVSLFVQQTGRLAQITRVTAPLGTDIVHYGVSFRAAITGTEYDARVEPLLSNNARDGPKYGDFVYLHENNGPGLVVSFVRP